MHHVRLFTNLLMTNVIIDHVDWITFLSFDRFWESKELFYFSRAVCLDSMFN